MNTKKLFTSALIYLAVAFAVFTFAFWHARMLGEGVSAGEWFPEQEYNERDPMKPAKPFFSLLSNRSYGTNERARLWLNYRDVDAIDFRVYRVNDPAKFFHGLDNPHKFGEEEESEFESYFRKRKPTFLEKLREFKLAFYRAGRDYFRAAQEQLAQVVQPTLPQPRRGVRGAALALERRRLRARAALKP